MPKTNQLFQCLVTRMSPLWNWLTTKNYWLVPPQINFFLVKMFLTDCQLNKIGNIFLSIMMIDLMILYSLLMVSINCSVHVAFVTWLESPAKTWPLWKSLGVLANSEEFQTQLIWARDHCHSQDAKSLNAKVSWILSMVGSTIPYSPFERAVTRPNWMLCNIVMVLAQILILVCPLSLKIC